MTTKTKAKAKAKARRPVTLKARVRRSNALATPCKGKGKFSCTKTAMPEGNVYRVSGTEIYRVASGYCHDCARKANVAHHRDATAQDRKAPLFKAPSKGKAKATKATKGTKGKATKAPRPAPRKARKTA